MPGRKFSGTKYRFGFNGKENDNEGKGDGNFIHFEFRDYESRLGRFLSIDPISNQYPFQSPYSFAANNPVKLIDVLGMGPGDPLNHKVKKGDNLTKISKKYGLSIDDLKKMNKLENDKILIGQNLKVNPESDFSDNPRGGYKNPNNAFGPELKIAHIAQIGMDFVLGKGTENTVIVGGGALKSVQNWNEVKWRVLSGITAVKNGGQGRPGDWLFTNFEAGDLPTNLKKGLLEGFQNILRGENPLKNNSQNTPIHVLGSFTMSIRINANGTTATVCIYDSKTFRSFSDGNASPETNKPRGDSENNSLTNTYQRYLWNVNLSDGSPIEYKPVVTITAGKD